MAVLADSAIPLLTDKNPNPLGLGVCQLTFVYNDSCWGQNSAPCRVIVGLRFAQSYILGSLFASPPLQSRRVERLFLCVIYAITRLASIVNIVNQPKSLP